MGHSGGLWILSCDSNSDYTLIDNMHQAITFQVTRRTDVWYCSFIYASPLFTNRCRLWEYLENLRTQVSGPWLLLGDFNEILYSYEVFGGRFNQSRASFFAQLMHQCHLLDIHCVGGLFTWRKNVYLVGHVRKKLDRVIADIDWQLAFPHAIVEVLPPHASDHNPMLLSCTKYKSKHAKLFHFQAAWITHPDYEALVYNTWSQTAGDAIAKLGSVRMHSITFNRDTFGNIFKKKRRLEARIKGIHTLLDLYPSSDLIRLEKDLQLEFSQVLEEEELLWFQKSQENWVKFGNKNPKFYHAQTVIHRRRNKVTSLQIDGIWCTDEDVLKGARAAFFKNLFQTSDTCVPDSLHLNSVPHIDSDLYALLVQPVSRREVRDALFSMAMVFNQFSFGLIGTLLLKMSGIWLLELSLQGILTPASQRLSSCLFLKLMSRGL